jgi:hypothetical protein
MNTMKKTIMIIAGVGALAQLLMATPAAAEEFFTIKNGELVDRFFAA